MKANPRRALALALPLALALLASCSDKGAIPAPAPVPSARPAPPPPLPPRPAIDWRAAPLTPGVWTWSMAQGQSVASFAGGLLELRCDKAAGMVTLRQQGTGAEPVPVTVITSALTRALTGTAQAGPPPAIAVALGARDPLLDAMAFSRGRFVVEMGGLPPLYVPSWPEVGRVIEDCR